MWKRLAGLLVVAGYFFQMPSAGAVSFEARSFDALAAEAEQVVIGTVAAKSARRTGAREIVTDYRFDNLKIIKGTVPAASLTVTMLGGSVGADSLAVAGAPAFRLGVRYLVFVSGNGSVMFPIVGGDQGIFQMRTDASSGVSRVHDYNGRPVTRLPQRALESMTDSAGIETAETMTEAAFVDAIRGRIPAVAR